MDERPASSSSYFARSMPPYRLLVRVYSAEGLRHVSSHGTYCKLYVGNAEMVSGSRTFARRTQKLSSSSFSQSRIGLLHASFNSSSRIKAAQPPLPPTSSSEGDLSGSACKMRVLKTQVHKVKQSDPVWNEKFEIPVFDLNGDVLSIRVKSARLMSSSAVGVCSISLKHVTGIQTTTVDRWFDLKSGKKEAGRIRLQLRLVDPSTASLHNSSSSTRARNHPMSDTHLSLPAHETYEEFAARTIKSSRRDHKYHRSARHFDGRLVTSTALESSSDSNYSANNEERKRVHTTRENSVSATSNESIDDSEPASDVSASPVVSPRLNRVSKEDESVTKTSFGVSGLTTKRSTSSPPVAATVGLDASHLHRGTMRRSELEHSGMKGSKILRLSRLSKSSRILKQQIPQEKDGVDNSDEYDSQHGSIKRWTGNHTQLSILSSSVDPRESSQMDFDDDDDDDEWDSRKNSVNNVSESIALSSTTSSALGSSCFSFSDIENDDEDDDVKSEKARELQRQQWQLEQRKMQLAEIKEAPQSTSDDESDDDDDDDDELDLNSSRMNFRPTIATLLCRESMNILFEEEDEEESPGPYKMSEEFVPILEAFSPMSVDSVDCALYR